MWSIYLCFDYTVHPPHHMSFRITTSTVTFESKQLDNTLQCSYCFSLSHNVVIPRPVAQPFHSWNIYPSLQCRSKQRRRYKRRTPNNTDIAKKRIIRSNSSIQLGPQDLFRLRRSVTRGCNHIIISEGVPKRIPKFLRVSVPTHNPV